MRGVHAPTRRGGDGVGRLMGAGVKHDAGKNRLDLWPVRAFLAIGDVISFGAKEYSPRNWESLDGFEDRFYAAALRHLTAWRLGDKLDPDSGLPHLAHAATNIVFLLSKQLGFDPRLVKCHK